VIMSLPFHEWVVAMSEEQRADPIWRMTAFQLALYAVDRGWLDAQRLDRERVTRPIAAQLYSALASIPAHIAEGYSRSSGPDRARFLEYGLGSARESSVWYYAARPILGSDLSAERRATLSRIRQLLLATIPRDRKRRIRSEER
jgi:four helix bundle protein